MIISLKGTPANQLKVIIRELEQEIGAIELDMKGLDINSLRLELIALDYQRSLLKKIDRSYNADGLDYLSKDQKYKNRSWWAYCPDKDPEYISFDISDLLGPPIQRDIFS